MLIDGEKWACEACVRGHRVSNCNHSDRPLQHINKKASPPAGADAQSDSNVVLTCLLPGSAGIAMSALPLDAQVAPTVVGHTDSCCCNHGGRCSCSHKKEPSLDTVPESESDQEPQPSKPKAVSRRRRANTTHSEPVLSFDENGHHKPPHKHNKASQKCGPYSLSRGHSMHSNASSSSLGNRSMDNLLHGKAPSRSRSRDLIEQETRKSKSEQASPLIDGGDSSFQQLNGQLPPLDLSGIRYPEYTSSFELFHGLDEQPMYSAGLSAVSVDWAQYDGLDMKADNFAPSSYDQAQSFAGFDLGSTEPTLTSNSGDVSETEDFVPAFSEAQMEGFRMSAATDYMQMSQSQTSMVSDSELGSGDFMSFKGAAAANKFLPNLGSLDDANAGFSMLEEDPYWSMNNFADGITNSPDPVASAFWGDAQ
ncbi:hypothetical protein JX265_001404 [Neoarthrinium moseri]|uniref:Copper-fist domain-containing protein n=1 Tax=Neoarthrinium moseri TaxID=1658444 RepID=A0A9P9WY61_9PEZI|nr:uncharacterized protein JN550_004060 [Neoarthrinium moseri]KAI1850443.1 hypothetical protein JX266_004301 [Neoarthrinium moseri]KAI1872341.1 hypothetical protein JN550_004060 [Neoarthrinium moseri]KAI1881164.1 hypothetical protein JX265_001404 [Neoarthrinium moseri]